MKKHIYFIIIFLSVVLVGCEGFLDERPDKSIVVPGTIDDLNLMLDNSEVLNFVPSMGVFSSDDIYFPIEAYNSLTNAVERNAYTWQPEIYEGEFPGDWRSCYQIVYFANVVLEKALEFLESDPDNAEIKEIVASARFFRGLGHYNAVSIFARQYDPAHVGELGIPLKLSQNVLERPVRSTLGESYEQILMDLEDAISDLPDFSAIKTRPSKYAVYGLLSRIYHSMGNYEMSRFYADSVLTGPYSLMDYNLLNSSILYPFERYNSEVVFHASLVHSATFSRVTTLVDTAMYNKYEDGDLRKSLYFIDRPTGKSFRGQYSGMFRWFGGIALDEMYLNYAEASIRLGQVEEGIEALNELLDHRYLTGTFEHYTADSIDDPMSLVVAERSKSLIHRGVNWLDLKRLNREGIYGRVLRRIVDGVEYELLPNDPRYVFPLPMEEVILNNMEQNPR
ncbi:RagB/SusD family nutrient uptake outer membrane protein [Litoribacter alkaliphilus]|uniref:RagB/SusD family nutrient uptake outer membrane protein n=1 Tax=Litoribacter ruber TaxID=702568 RepID=A0AAP2CLL3_9BACT|nr:RagB/SusD family nutrient uptake outer membrane protein [Litoribacter alkaliphilus]MBS9525989.1 RagB/SusD family nutrient uptake outer membrane protein [Litoribacter alkaliphilus]